MSTFEDAIRASVISLDSRPPAEPDWVVRIHCGPLEDASRIHDRLVQQAAGLVGYKALRAELSEMSIAGRGLGADSVAGLYLEKWARRLLDVLGPEPEEAEEPPKSGSIPNGPLRVIAINWTEHERGWGSRPDGHTLHRDAREALRYAAEATSGRDRGPVPDEYSAPGEMFEVEVSLEKYTEVQSAGTVWGHVRDNLPEP